MWPFKPKREIETRSSGTGYTSQLMQLREAYITGSSGLAELSGTVQSCISMWEFGLSGAEVTGAADYLTPPVLATIARSLALRGEFVGLLSADRLIPCSDWDMSTGYSKPTAYRVSIPEIGGGKTETALAAEVVHIRIGADISQPWTGQAPLRRSSLTAGLLHSLESALSEIFEFAPLGTQIVSFPESTATDLEKLGHSFKGRRGRVLLKESTNVVSAGGPTPNQDWRPQDTSPDLSKSMTSESLSAARDSIAMAFGVLPAMFNSSTTGPLIREAQRHLAAWTLDPICKLIAHEVTEKLATPVTLDCLEPLQAFDLGGRARALSAIVGALAEAKAAGVDPNQALDLVNWDQD